MNSRLFYDPSAITDHFEIMSRAEIKEHVLTLKLVSLQNNLKNQQTATPEIAGQLLGFHYLELINPSSATQST